MKSLTEVKETIEALNGVSAEISGETLVIHSEKYPAAIAKYAAKKGINLEIISETEIAGINQDEFPTFESVMIVR